MTGWPHTNAHGSSGVADVLLMPALLDQSQLAEGRFCLLKRFSRSRPANRRPPGKMG